MSGYFVDTSALAKLFHPEAGSEKMELLAQTPGARLIISELSLIEIQSVFATKVRTGVIDQVTLRSRSTSCAVSFSQSSPGDDSRLSCWRADT